ncbi:uncharacterized protein LOC144436954 [Glandiceps talaboti]
MDFFAIVFLLALIFPSKSDEFGEGSNQDQVIVCIKNVKLSATLITWDSPLPPDITTCDFSYGRADGTESYTMHHGNRPSSGFNFMHPSVKPGISYKISASCTTEDGLHLKAKEMIFQTGVKINVTMCSNDSDSTAPYNDNQEVSVDHSYKMNITDLVLGVIVGSVGIGIIIIAGAVIHSRIKRWRRLRRFLRIRDDDGLANFPDNFPVSSISTDSQL